MREVHDVMLGSDSGSDDAKATCVICVDDMVKERWRDAVPEGKFTALG
jgi:hypothetical protein